MTLWEFFVGFFFQKNRMKNWQKRASWWSAKRGAYLCVALATLANSFPLFYLSLYPFALFAFSSTSLHTCSLSSPGCSHSVLVPLLSSSTLESACCLSPSLRTLRMPDLDSCSFPSCPMDAAFYIAAKEAGQMRGVRQVGQRKRRSVSAGRGMHRALCTFAHHSASRTVLSPRVPRLLAWQMDR